MENPIKNITETITGEFRNFKHTLKEILYAIVIVFIINTFFIPRKGGTSWEGK